MTPPVTGPLGTPSLVSPAADSRFTPGTNLTFDWGDVANAARYTIEISNDQNFSSTVVNSRLVAIRDVDTADGAPLVARSRELGVGRRGELLERAAVS